MADNHEPEIPAALEGVLLRLGELEVVLGKQVGPALDAVRAALIAAMAARDRGDVPGAVQQIGQAMNRLAALADDLDPAEAAMMRRLAETFRAALLRGDTSGAKQRAAAMFEKSGAREKKSTS